MHRLSLSFTLFFVAVFALPAGCDPETPTTPLDDGGTPNGVYVRFEPAAGAMDVGAIPFPDDLYLDEGRVSLGAFPSEESALDPAYVASMRQSFRRLDGFGVSSPIFFWLEGALDPSSLPATPAASRTEDASVFLVDVDTASSEPFARVPASVRYVPSRSLLVVSPWDGHALMPGRRYAAVVTRGVRAADGSPMVASPRFAAIRDAASRPADPVDGEAWAQYDPVLASLATHGVTRGDVVAMAVFRVQTVAPDLADARAQLRALPAPALRVERVVAAGAELDTLLGVQARPGELGSDAEGGVAHAHMSHVIDVTFESPSLESETEGAHGQWEREGSAFRIKRMARVWMTLAIPAGVDLSDVPVVLFQHGIGGQRADMFSFADALCEAGFIVAAIDAPYHGMRVPGGAQDRAHRWGTPEVADMPDLFGDAGGSSIYLEYLGVGDASGELEPFHPFYVRDILRQSVLDLMAATRVLEEADLTPIVDASGPAITTADRPIGFLGISLGGILGTVFVAAEPRVGAAVLTVTGGHLSQLVAWSPSFESSFLPILFPKVGLDYGALDHATLPAALHPEVALFQTLIDAGDSMSFGPILARSSTHVLMHMSRWDETVPNIATEGLARTIGAPIVGGAPTYTDLEMRMAPLSGNLSISDLMVTRGLLVWEPANHGLLSVRGDATRWAHPPEPPFMSVATTPLASPIDDAAAVSVHFFETWLAGAPEIIAAP